MTTANQGVLGDGFEGTCCKQQKICNSEYENRFQASSDQEDGGEFKEYSVDVPPIVVHFNHSFSNIVKILENKCKHKRMSDGTKVMQSFDIRGSHEKSK